MLHVKLLYTVVSAAVHKADPSSDYCHATKTLIGHKISDTWIMQATATQDQIEESGAAYIDVAKLIPILQPSCDEVVILPA